MYDVGIIGLGQIAYSIDKDPNRKIIWSHIKAYESFSNIKIKAICDVNINLVKNIKKECNIEKGYTDYNLMLKENKFDIVSICTPISTHLDIIRICIKNKVKAIFCEKTISYSSKEAKVVLDMCKEDNIIFAVNYILRWDNINKTIKTLLENNVIGKIYTIVGYGATALYTSTSHLIDLMLYFSNSNPTWVVGEKQKDFIRIVHGEKDCGGIGMIGFKSGIIGFVKSVSESPNKYMLEIDIIGEHGRIRLYDNGTKYDIYQYKKNKNNAGKEYEQLKLVKSEAPYPNERMINAIQNIIDCLENKNDKLLSSGETAIDSIKIIEAIKESSDMKKIIFIN